MKWTLFTVLKAGDITESSLEGVSAAAIPAVPPTSTITAAAAPVVIAAPVSTATGTVAVSVRTSATAAVRTSVRHDEPNSISLFRSECHGLR